MRPDSSAHPQYTAAFQEIVGRIAKSLSDTPGNLLPIRMFVAGGAAVHFYTGHRLSRDVDAAFSHRLLLPDDLAVSYRDPDGAAQMLYFDRQYNDTFALMHEDAQDDSVPLDLENVDAKILDIRLLTPLDLAVSKISRFSERDRNDIRSLSRHGLIHADELRQRATEAADYYVGNKETVQTSIKLACQLVMEETPHESGDPDEDPDEPTSGYGLAP